MYYRINNEESQGSRKEGRTGDERTERNEKVDWNDSEVFKDQIFDRDC